MFVGTDSEYAFKHWKLADNHNDGTVITRKVSIYKVLYRHVHSDTNSTSLGSIHPLCKYCMKTVQSHISTTISQVLTYTAV